MHNQNTENINSKKELPKNIVIKELPYATFRIIYGKHNIEQDPKDIEGLDGVVLEGIGDYSTIESAYKILEACYESIQYKRIVEKAEKDRQSIFFADIVEEDVTIALQESLLNIEPIAGVLLLVSLVNDALKKQKMTRREFLKRSGKLLSGLFFSTHILEYPLWLTGKDEEARSIINRFVLDLNERIHPETNLIVLTLRNHLLAQKMQTIAEFTNSERKKPEIGIIIGHAHIGIERSLEKKSEERTEIIKKILNFTVSNRIKEKIAKICWFNFHPKTNRWNAVIFEDPFLLTFINDNQQQNF